MHIHVPRTGGGTFRALVDKISGIRYIDADAHLPYSHMVVQCGKAGRPLPPAIGFIRNPWDWYVSRWRQLRGDRKIQLSFSEFMEKAKAGCDESSFRTYTALCDYYGIECAQYIGRFEQYEDAVVCILLAVVPDLVTEKWLRASLAEVGRHKHYREPQGGAYPYQEYYVSEMVEWVVGNDAALIERYGYTFD
jgi:hypothetical protein